MKNVLNMIAAIAVAIAVGAITFVLVFPLLAGEAHRNYTRLINAWNTPSMRLLDLRDSSGQVSQQTGDENLRFVSKQLASIASVLSDLGYKQLGEVNAATKVELFGRAFIEGFVNPAINLKTIPLWWNAKEFEERAKLLDVQNKRMGVIRLVAAGGVALLAFWILRRTRQKI